MRTTEEGVEIFLEDLKEDVQRELLKLLGYEKPEDGNLDVFPLFTLPVE